MCAVKSFVNNFIGKLSVYFIYILCKHYLMKTVAIFITSEVTTPSNLLLFQKEAYRHTHPELKKYLLLQKLPFLHHSLQPITVSKRSIQTHNHTHPELKNSLVWGMCLCVCMLNFETVIGWREW